jgi:hypothetical protein
MVCSQKEYKNQGMMEVQGKGDIPSGGALLRLK